MKSFIKCFGVLSILLFQFTSCLNDDKGKKPVYYFYDEPVVVDQMGDSPLIRNEAYRFYVPELTNDAELKVGDLLWSSFIVDLENNQTQPNGNRFSNTATQFRYKTVDSAKVIIPTNADEFNSYLSDDYSAPIELAGLYRYAIDSLWFFGFKHNDYSASYTYELILNPVIESDGNSYPTLYIRAKQVGTDNSEKPRSHDGNLIFAFDASDFAAYYSKTISATGAARFNLKYKTGIGLSGKDVYKSFMSNPLLWDFNTRKPE
jgi:hypothetical protein